jgi:hypothetical protein
VNRSLVAQNLGFVGELYCRRYVDLPDGWSGQNLEADWWAGLRFFFDHTFMQNRPALTSERLAKLTVDTLNTHIQANRDSAAAYRILQSAVRRECLDSLMPPETAEAVDGYKSGAQLNNQRDRRMVREVLAYVANNPDQRNIYSAIISHLRATGDHESDLAETNRFLKTFHGVGDKIAPFVIQDVALLNRKVNLIPRDLSVAAFRFTFPIDTLIRQIAPALGCDAVTENSDDRIRNFFIEISVENNIYPPLCAAALWYLAYFSTDILLEHCIKTRELG